MADPDAIARGEAFAQALERGKHGGAISLPSHLEGCMRKSKRQSATCAASAMGQCDEVTASPAAVARSPPTVAAKTEADHVGDCGRPHIARDSLSELNLNELRRIIDDEALPVKKNVGGVTRRTKEQIVADVRSARAARS